MYRGSWVRICIGAMGENITESIDITLRSYLSVYGAYCAYFPIVKYRGY